MTHAELRSLALAILAAFLAILLSACETAAPRVSARNLPTYEPPIAKSKIQSVRTTAYTHTEADHTAFTNHNALGGTLQPASVPRNRRAEVRAGAVLTVSVTRHLSPEAFSGDQSLGSMATVSKTSAKDKKTTKKKPEVKKAIKVTKPVIGSAAADWSRWPAGTTFKVLSTGQTYRIDDYGWALSGRNTIDLYMANQREMNSWGAREEKIQVLHWGDPQESLRILSPHEEHKHIKRMILELEGRDEEAAALR